MKRKITAFSAAISCRGYGAGMILGGMGQVYALLIRLRLRQYV